MATHKQPDSLPLVPADGLTDEELAGIRNLAAGERCGNAPVLASACAKLGAPNLFNALAKAALAGLIGPDELGLPPPGPGRDRA